MIKIRGTFNGHPVELEIEYDGDKVATIMERIVDRMVTMVPRIATYIEQMAKGGH